MNPKAVIFGCSGLELTADERAFFRDTDPLGFIVFARNIDSPDQARKLIDDLRVGSAQVDNLPALRNLQANLHLGAKRGSQHQIAMEMLKQRAGINLLHVPYKGGSPATTAAVAGEVAAVFSGTSSAGQIRAGKLRALASTGRKRSEQFPELPTIGELYPGYELVIWLAVYAPAGTP